MAAFQLPTTRLLLRSWERDDLEAFLPIVQDPEVMRYIGPGQTWSIDQTTQFIADQIENQQRLGYCLWAVTLRQGGPVIGFCGGKPLTWNSGEREPWSNASAACADEQRGNQSTESDVEIGWRLARAHWGQGYATEAARTVVAYLQEERAVNRLVAFAQTPNKASIHIMEKLGMHYEGICVRNGNTVVQYTIESPWSRQ